MNPVHGVSKIRFHRPRTGCNAASRAVTVDDFRHGAKRKLN